MNFDFKKYGALKEARPLQEQVIPEIIKAFEKKKFFILEAPTGIGKSYITLTLANYYANQKVTINEEDYKGSNILVNQKILQQQYVKENWTNIVNKNKMINNINSSVNYFCDSLPNLGITCAQVHRIRKVDKNVCGNCKYFKDKQDYVQNNIGLTNLQYYLNLAAYTKDLPNRNLLIIDEAHSIEEQILNFISIEINENTVFNKFKINLPSVNNDQELINWLDNILLPSINDLKDRNEALTKPLLDLQKRSKVQDAELKRLFEEIEFLDKYGCKIRTMLGYWTQQTWVLTRETSDSGHLKYVFRPILIDRFTEDLLFNKASKVLLLSATILRHKDFCLNLGINPDNSEFLSLPSPFPKENRPIYPIGAGSMSMKNLNNTMPNLISAIEKLLDHHKGVRGVIHCHTYSIGDKIFKQVSKKHQKRLLFHTSLNRESVLEHHLKHGKDTVLLTPSMSEGVDLKDDFSRFQILCKIPFPYLGDKRIQMKKELQPWWYSFITVKTVVQSLGRSIRSEKDYAVSYILDSDWEFFYRMNKNLFPGWIKEAIID
jgi:Rad3-related DNA helicase